MRGVAQFWRNQAYKKSATCDTYETIFSSTFRRKKVELLSSLRRQRLGQLSFLSESISQKLSKVSIWNLKYLFTIKRGTNYNKTQDEGKQNKNKVLLFNGSDVLLYIKI